ncbi:MAG: sugar phosphate nucleotidyltransferase [Elusimicrobiota bacterium]|nr:sugar phosphate nucleotidyltransferase [Elusimicrobiota bacterium]
MKALLLAAGVGSRLRPLTDATPKALIPVGGTPLLERALVHLKEAGCDSFVVNAHHHADQVAGFCATLASRYGVSVRVSREDDLLLDTGGGLKKAAPLLAGDEPFFVRNADVLTDLDPAALLAAHRAASPLATLAVRERASARAFLFDEAGRLVGHADDKRGATRWAKGPVAGARRLSFDGVHVVSPLLPGRLTEDGAFSIVDAYLRLASEGADIRAFDASRWSWFDVGTPAKLAAADAWARGRS